MNLRQKFIETPAAQVLNKDPSEETWSKAVTPVEKSVMTFFFVVVTFIGAQIFLHQKKLKPNFGTRPERRAPYSLERA